MSNNKLELIDFSKGIRSTEIQQNFNILQQELNKERISVGGAGISYGLDFTLNEFNLTISQGCLIDNNGENILFNERSIDIEKPILISKKEVRKTIDKHNRIYLSEIPYALNRITSSSNVPIKNSGISVNISNVSGSSSIVNVSSVEENVINVGTNIESLIVDISYFYTAKRIDVIFIDNEYNISCRTGITSTSPSVPRLNDNEFIYILGYIEVDGMKKEYNNVYNAEISIIKEFKSIRNVYTDTENNLYLCGTPFSSIKIIHTAEPTNPSIDTFWYDDKLNKLKVWRRTDIYEFSDVYKYMSIDPDNPQLFKTNIKYLYGQGQLAIFVNDKRLSSAEFIEGSDISEEQQQSSQVYSEEFKIIKDLNSGDIVSYNITRYDGFEEWVSINDSSYISCEERHIWTPEMLSNEILDKNHDLKHFFFDAKLQKNLIYTPGTNSLKVMIDQIPLHSDQYDEITMYDAITGIDSLEIKNKLLNYYGYYDTFSPDQINKEYENIGIGFKLHASLEKTAYVEVNVTQRTNSNPITKRFQRSATFIDEGSFKYQNISLEEDPTQEKQFVFTTKVPFRYQENQIDVFLNGLLLERGIQYKEDAKEDDLKGCNLYSFKLLPASNVKANDKISYKVTTSVYSYDHVSGLLSGFETRFSNLETNVQVTLDNVKTTSKYIDNKIEEIEGILESLRNIQSNIDSNYIKTTTKLGKENLTAEIYKGIAEKNINSTYAITSIPYTVDVTAICANNDFIILYNTTRNILLQRNSDYSIITNNGVTTLNVTTSSAANSTLYLSGIKFNMAT